MDSTVQDGQLWASPPFVQHHPCPDSQEKGRQRLTRSRRLTVCEYPPESLEITVVLELSTTTTSGKPSPALTESSGILDSTIVSQVQKVLSSRQWQPHPVGHTSWVRNHSIMWLVWPPCPQVRQKLDEPRTATWQMAHWNVKPLQMAH